MPEKIANIKLSSGCSLRTVPTTIPKYSYAVYYYAGNADLSKGYWNTK